MTERTYGMADYTLEEIESSDAYEEFSSSTVKALATHIRELQAELAELKLQHIATLSQAAELESERMDLLKQIEFHLNQLSVFSGENAKLKAKAKDAARYQWLRNQHEAQEDHSDTEGFSWKEPSPLAFTVFAPTYDECLGPIGCFPGELDKAIDAAMQKEPK